MERVAILAVDDSSLVAAMLRAALRPLEVGAGPPPTADARLWAGLARPGRLA